MEKYQVWLVIYRLTRYTRENIEENEEDVGSMQKIYVCVYIHICVRVCLSLCACVFIYVRNVYLRMRMRMRVRVRLRLRSRMCVFMCGTCVRVDRLWLVHRERELCARILSVALR